MRLNNTLIVVTDMEQSKAFYRELFDLFVVHDFGDNVILTSGIVLQEKAQWEELIGKKVTIGNGTELFFKERNFDNFLKKLERYGAKVISKPTMNSWGKQCVRLEDLDGHYIEVAEI